MHRLTELGHSFFTPHALEGTGSKFQDGGTFALNPTHVALAESRAIMSAWRGTPYHVPPPDFLLSLGTGFVDPNRLAESPSDAVVADDDPQAVRRAFREGGIGQMCAYLHTTLCGHTKSLEFEAANPELITQGRYCRLDLPFPSRLPRLDDAASITTMRDRAERFFIQSPQLRRVADVMVSSMFYLEPTDARLNDTGHYVVTGHILCRWRRQSPQYDAFRRHVLDSQSCFVVSDLAVVRCSVDGTGNLSQSVSIRLQDLSTPVHIHLRTASGSSNHISGSPFDMEPIWEAWYFRRALGHPGGAPTTRGAEVRPLKRKRLTR
jgi:hypothetical protein